MRRKESSFTTGMNGVMGVGCGCVIMIAVPILFAVLVAALMPAMSAVHKAREKVKTTATQSAR